MTAAGLHDFCRRAILHRAFGKLTERGAAFAERLPLALVFGQGQRGLKEIACAFLDCGGSIFLECHSKFLRGGTK